MEARRRLSISLNELSEAKVSHLERMVEKMKSAAYVCIHPHQTEWFVVTSVILDTILNV